MTGLVLAGGTSTRMGRDKALLEVDGERLVDRAVRCLGQCCAEVLVAPGPARPLTVARTRTIADAPGQGPLAGIVAGLEVATTPLLAVVAADMPAVSAAVLRALAAAWQGEAGVAARVDGVVQPLHALYATAWAPQYAQLLAAGEHSPRRALLALHGRIVSDPVWRVIDPQGSFVANLNSPAHVADFSGR